MKFLKSDIDFDKFFHRLGRAKSRVLMLDYDGTLAPFRVARDKAFPYPGVRTALEAIQEVGTCRLVIVSGRAMDDLIPLIGLEKTPEIWGSHGWERMLTDGTRVAPELPRDAEQGLAEAIRWAEGAGLKDRLEPKPASVAIHWRGLGDDEIASIREQVSSGLGRTAGDRGLVLSDFDGGIELRVPGRDKGDAVGTILSESGKDTVAAYLGDDLTDEDAFEALEGRGLGVLVSPKLRKTAADLWITPPHELMDFLNMWARTLRGEYDA